MCIKCEETYNNASGPAPGYSSVGGYIGSGSFGFKTKDYAPTNKILNEPLDDASTEILNEPLDLAIIENIVESMIIAAINSAIDALNEK